MIVAYNMLCCTIIPMVHVFRFVVARMHVLNILRCIIVVDTLQSGHLIAQS